MSRVGWYRCAIVLASLAVLEALSLAGIIDRITMQAPHLIARDFYRIVVSGRMNSAILKTLANTLAALGLALGVGIVAAVLLHRARALRDTLDPLFATYYAVPVFAFYPFFIVVFGLGDLPQILIGFMLGVVAMIVNTLNGLDRVPGVLLKTARILRLPPADVALRITLPAAAPHIVTGVKLAVAYAFIGVIGSEFILSRGGIGYEISFAYTNFDNAVMYPLIVLILLASIAINAALSRWERALLERRGML
ncbi:MAG TPA: ABC transporter permease subunit [Casimicrobiaceae bacterium]|nr:ABC transporter permease subunit [Casimicrobiaceae bacterium]